MLSLVCAILVVVPAHASGVASVQHRNRISGRVANTADKPVENVRVTLLSGRLAQTAVEYTDSSGRFMFENLPRGTYSVLAEPIGTEYEQQSVQVEINPYAPTDQGGSETIRIDFVLRQSEKKHGKGPPGAVFYQPVPEPARKEYRGAVESLRKGDFERAAASLRRATEIFPDYYAALELLGTEHVKRHEYQDALPLLSRAVELNRSDWRSFYALGLALIELKRPADAVIPLRHAVELNPDWAYTHLRLGIAICLAENESGEATKELKEALRLGGDKLPEAHLYLAFIYDRSGKYQEATAALEAYLRGSRDVIGPAQREYYEELLDQIRRKAAEKKAN